jgi:hypothetical protein
LLRTCVPRLQSSTVATATSGGRWTARHTAMALVLTSRICWHSSAAKG